MRTATASDGTTIAYHVFGRSDGEPLLMVQGLGADSRGWALQRVPFGRRFRCIAVDNRGVGGSAGAPRPYSLVEMAADAVAVLDAEGVERAHLMGASMGGAIAQFLAVEHSERVRSLVLACTACKHHDWRRELLREWADAVQDRLAELACHVRSFQVEGGRLDEVFRTLTTASAGEVHRT